MTNFNYIAMDSNGREQSGTVTAESESDATTALKRRGLFPTSVAPVPGQNGSSTRGPARRLPRNPLAWTRSLSEPKISGKSLCPLTRQLATLLKAGMPLIRALRTLMRQTKDPEAHRVLASVAEQIEGGQTLSEALAMHPASFSGLYVNMVRAGEASGALEEVLLRQAEFLEKHRRLCRKIKSALTYPLVVCSIAILITAGLMIFVVPKFAQIFEEMLSGHPLPLLTRGVIAVSGVMLQQAHIVLGALVLGVLIWRGLRKTRTGAYWLDVAAMRLPPFGSLVTLSTSAHFCQTLGTLMRSGVAVLQALDIVRDTSGNRVVARAVQRVHDAVKEGETMSAPLHDSGIFPPMLVGMVEVGEETGALPEMLDRVAESYEEEVDNAVEALTSLIEPAMIVFLAVVVGTIVIALFMPLIVMISAFGGGN
ncbi:MAG: hypothetical protein A3K19_32710 [Lentisphaerae bacterium RIFOXYB12_FULL_65_16]|nr:MAG: hypothetical protein A3K18_07855 [Lentisphaerae bacterium RIFOXYA12_64_32]OGV84458.1 MAG: hypothetical protein A3K19_32710 [Lentisphaerae bacterium RIFOXYB12_FULL_65_16]